jgi:alpha-L-fucosidase
MKILLTFTTILHLSCMASFGGFDPFHEAPEEYAARAQWLRDAKVGVFVHWNPSSLIAREISWSRNDYGASNYDQLYKQFKGEKFNADDWVKLFYDSGIRYAVIVSKHHDGFSMFDTKVPVCSEYSVMKAPFGRDYVKEMSDACHRGGVKFCLYYSVLDWWNPKYSGKEGADLTAYKEEVFKPQMQELLTKYGDVGYIWFDGSWEDSWTHADGREMYGFIRRLQPSTLIGNRIEPRHFRSTAGVPEVDCVYPGPDGVGDYAAREVELGNYDTNKAWDKCLQLAPASPYGGWSWDGEAMNLRSCNDLITYLIECIGRDGGLLLGVGPRPDGTIDPTHAARMLEFGDWLKLNGEAVYGTRGGPYLPGNWGVSTRKGDKVFLFIQRWKGDASKLPVLPCAVKSARLLTRGNVKVEKDSGDLVVHVPEDFHRPIATIVELTLDGDSIRLPVIQVPDPKNLALGKPVEVSGFWPGREEELNKTHITDGNPATLWASNEEARDAWVTVDLQKECEVSQAMLSDAPYGRTQAFDLEAQVGGEWRKVAQGTTIGIKLYLEFPPLKARLFRLNIRKASDTPTLAEFQLFGN